jgi:DNA-binding transcriptional MerR regulator
MGMFGCFGYNLTTDQQTELQQLITTLRNQNATPQEMQSAIQQKLEEFGVFDTQLENQIAQTEQRLTILNREKELRNQGYNWTEVRNMIQDEFDLQNSTNGDLGMMQGQRFVRRPGRGPNGGRDFIPNETVDQ